MSEDSPIRVFLVDDHAIVREGFVALIAMEPGFVVVGQASCSAEALALLESLTADVLLLDLYLADGHGTDLLIALNRRGVQLPTIVLSSYGRDDNVFRALQAGARGYLLKSISAVELFTAIRVVLGGGTWVSEELGTFATHSVTLSSLTDRERQVLQVLADGCSNDEIAQCLSLSLSTVKSHVANIMRKLKARNRTDVVAKARAEGILPP